MVDLEAVVERDPAVRQYSTPLLYLKGFQAIQSYRIAHWLWENKREELAYFMQHMMSVIYGVDIQPIAVG